MEGRMEITQLELSSSLGDGVCYLHDEEDPVGPFHQPGWWYDPTAIRTKNTPTDTTINIVKIKHKNWREFGLDWPDSESKEVANTVVYANFTKNEN
jgi:hypothetical protein